MFIYSETTKAFLINVRSLVREIVTIEMKLTMERSRLYMNGIFYPLNIVVFEDQTRLGYFDSRLFELGLSKTLMIKAHPKVLKNVIRHELAHFMCFIIHGPVKDHGEEFKSICRKYDWEDEVEKAYANIELLTEECIGDLQTEKILIKCKKLLALTTSDNEHERELATLKANQLILDHNLEQIKKNSHHEQEQDPVFVKRVLESQRKSAKHHAIYEILKTFYVTPVFNHGKGVFYLEVIGGKTSVELADYVASFLNLELETMWNNVKKNNPQLTNITAKNSFMRGVASGYVSKIEAQKNVNASKSDLILITQSLKKQLSTVYQRIGHSKIQLSKENISAKEIGIKSGQNLSIKPAIDSNNSLKRFLNHLKS